MLAKVLALVETFPDYQHQMYIPTLDFFKQVKAQGYNAIFTDSDHFHIKVSKNKTYNGSIDYRYNLLPHSIDNIMLIVKYTDGEIPDVQGGPGQGECLNNAFLGYDESCVTLPEIHSKIISIVYGDIPVSVNYIYYKRAIVKISRHSKRLC